MTAPATALDPRLPPTLRVSNPDRVVDPQSGLKKLDLVRYYESVADWILPHLVGRPVSLVRGPNGIEGELFFQKHGDKLAIPGIRESTTNYLDGGGATNSPAQYYRIRLEP